MIGRWAASLSRKVQKNSLAQLEAVEPSREPASVDQFIAAALAETDPTPFPSIETGVNAAQDNDQWRTRMSFRGPNDPVSPEDDPMRVFQRLFADGLLNGAEFERLRSRRLSVLDAVHEDLAAVTSRVSAVCWSLQMNRRCCARRPNHLKKSSMQARVRSLPTH